MGDGRRVDAGERREGLSVLWKTSSNSHLVQITGEVLAGGR